MPLEELTSSLNQIGEIHGRNSRDNERIVHTLHCNIEIECYCDLLLTTT